MLGQPRRRPSCATGSGAAPASDRSASTDRVESGGQRERVRVGDLVVLDDLGGRRVDASRRTGTARSARTATRCADHTPCVRAAQLDPLRRSAFADPSARAAGRRPARSAPTAPATASTRARSTPRSRRARPGVQVVEHARHLDAGGVGQPAERVVLRRPRPGRCRICGRPARPSTSRAAAPGTLAAAGTSRPPTQAARAGRSSAPRTSPPVTASSSTARPPVADQCSRQRSCSGVVPAGTAVAGQAIRSRGDPVRLGLGQVRRRTGARRRHGQHVRGEDVRERW